MLIRRPYDSFVFKSTCPGDPIRVDFAKKYDESGNPFLVKVGTTDLYGYIQSFADECDVNRIVKRYLMGDDSVVNVRPGFYIDSTGMPRDLADAMQKLHYAADVFEKLPGEVRADYPDFNSFLSAFESKDSFERLNASFLKVMKHDPGDGGNIDES